MIHRPSADIVSDEPIEENDSQNKKGLATKLQIQQTEPELSTIDKNLCSSNGKSLNLNYEKNPSPKFTPTLHNPESDECNPVTDRERSTPLKSLRELQPESDDSCLNDNNNLTYESDESELYLGTRLETFAYLERKERTIESYFRKSRPGPVKFVLQTFKRKYLLK